MLGRQPRPLRALRQERVCWERTNVGGCFPECEQAPGEPIVIERDGETISTPLDKRAAGKGFPGEGFARREGSVPGRAVLWNATEAVAMEPAPEAVWGAYPQRFIPWALR